MNQIQMRLEVQGAVQNWVDTFMLNNNIPASMMEDAINKALISVKDKALQEFILAATVQVDPSIKDQNTEKDE